MKNKTLLTKNGQAFFLVSVPPEILWAISDFKMALWLVHVRIESLA